MFSSSFLLYLRESTDAEHDVGLRRRVVKGERRQNYLRSVFFNSRRSFSASSIERSTSSSPFADTSSVQGCFLIDSTNPARSPAKPRLFAAGGAPSFSSALLIVPSRERK